MTDPMKYDDTSAGRKATPVYTGVVRYFPAALALVSKLSKAGNDKHNPGQEMHHARGKSMDHGDCIVRHQAGVGTVDENGLDHAVGVAWRALAQLQEIAEREHGWPVAPGAKVAAPVVFFPDPENPKAGDLFRSESAVEIGSGVFVGGVFRVLVVLHESHVGYERDRTAVKMRGMFYVARTNAPCWEPVPSDYTGPVHGE